MALADGIGAVAPCARALQNYGLLPGQVSVRAAVPLVAGFTPAHLARVAARIDRSALALFAPTAVGVDTLLGKIDAGSALESDEIAALHALRQVHPSLFLGADAPVPASWGCHAGRVNAAGLGLLLSALPPPPITPVDRWRELAGMVHYFVEIIHGRRPTPDELPPPFVSLQDDGTRGKWAAGHFARIFGNPEVAVESFRSAAQIKILRTLMTARGMHWKHSEVVDNLLDARRYFQKIPDAEAVRVLSNMIGVLYCCAQHSLVNAGFDGETPDIEWLLKYPTLAEQAFTAGQNTFGVEEARVLQAESLGRLYVKSPQPLADRWRAAAQMFDELGRPADRMAMFAALARQATSEGDMQTARAAAGTVAEIAQQFGDIEPAVTLWEDLGHWHQAEGLVMMEGTPMQQAAHHVRYVETHWNLTPGQRANKYWAAAGLVADTDPRTAVGWALKALRLTERDPLWIQPVIAQLRRLDEETRAQSAETVAASVRKRLVTIFFDGQAWRTMETLLARSPVEAAYFLKRLATEVRRPSWTLLSDDEFTAWMDHEVRTVAASELLRYSAWHELSIVAARLAGEPDLLNEIVEGAAAVAWTPVDRGNPIAWAMWQGVQDLMWRGRYDRAAALIEGLEPLRKEISASTGYASIAATLVESDLHGLAADLLEAAAESPSAPGPTPVSAAPAA